MPPHVYGILRNVTRSGQHQLHKSLLMLLVNGIKPVNHFSGLACIKHLFVVKSSVHFLVPLVSVDAVNSLSSSPLPLSFSPHRQAPSTGRSVVIDVGAADRQISRRHERASPGMQRFWWNTEVEHWICISIGSCAIHSYSAQLLSKALLPLLMNRPMLQQLSKQLHVLHQTRRSNLQGKSFPNLHVLVMLV